MSIKLLTFKAEPIPHECANDLAPEIRQKPLGEWVNEDIDRAVRYQRALIEGANAYRLMGRHDIADALLEAVKI